MTQTYTQAQIQRYREQLTANIERTTDADLSVNDYLRRKQQQTGLNQPPAARNMQALPPAAKPLAPAQPIVMYKETMSEKKKRESLEKQRKKAEEAMYKADVLESSVTTTFYRVHRLTRLNVEGKVDAPISKEELKQEKAVLNARLNAILQKEQADIEGAQMNGPLTEQEEKQIRLDAQKKRVEVYHMIATQMPLGSKERKEFMEKKEEEVLKADRLKRELKVAGMPDGPEKEREAATIKRHAKFDSLKVLFRKPSVYSHEDAKLRLYRKELINKGRATLGGTKAMYIFEERKSNGTSTGQEWLFKEATNCVGMEKPEGAVVTAEASRLQQRLRGNLSIPAECLKVDGKVVGSIQKRVQKVEGGVDLFQWQAQEQLTQLPETTMKDLMHEHTLDWILCNFDTKGENFINQHGGHIISFDKEASFNTLLKEDSRHMSYTFKPHSNDTIYNTMFKAYAEGKIRLDLDANLESIKRLEEMDSDTFLNMFRETLTTKYGKHTSDRRDADRLLRERHQNLRNEYRTFFTQLIRERLEHMNGNSPENQEEREHLMGMMRNGIFAFADERAADQ